MKKVEENHYYFDIPIKEIIEKFELGRLKHFKSAEILLGSDDIRLTDSELRITFNETTEIK